MPRPRRSRGASSSALMLGKFVGITGATALVRAMGRGQLAPGLGPQPHRGRRGALGHRVHHLALPRADRDLGPRDPEHRARRGADSIRPRVLRGMGRARRRRPRVASAARRRDAAHASVRCSARPLPRECGGPARDRRVRRLRVPVLQPATGSIDAVLEHFGESRVRWVWRHLPLDAPHPHAQEAAQAAEAARCRAGSSIWRRCSSRTRIGSRRPISACTRRDLGLGRGAIHGGLPIAAGAPPHPRRSSGCRTHGPRQHPHLLRQRQAAHRSVRLRQPHPGAREDDAGPSIRARRSRCGGREYPFRADPLP